jgi:flavin-dependent dehydrogenase
MCKELTSGSFFPCKGNLLLVGEAGGLLMPLMAGDGIREAIWSGILAAISIIRGAESGIKADRFYSNKVARIVKMLGTIYPWRERIKEQIIKGDKQILEVLERLWQETLNISLDDISIPKAWS